MFDGKAFGQEIVAATKAFVERSLAPITIRLNAIERAVADQPKMPSPEELSERFKGFIESEVAKAVAAIPVPKDGVDGKDGLPGEPGKDGTPGKDGIDGKDGAPGRDGIDGKEGPVGKNGVGLAGLLIDRDNNLVATMTDGATKNLGRVVGKDGKDGLNAADFKIEWAQESDRELSVTCAAPGSVSKSVFRFPIVLDRGVYKEGQAYCAGDAVTWGGSLWIAQADTTDKPDGGKGWRLAVKRGRDGRDGKDAPQPHRPVVFDATK